MGMDMEFDSLGKPGRHMGEQGTGVVETEDIAPTLGRRTNGDGDSELW